MKKLFKRCIKSLARIVLLNNTIRTWVRLMISRLKFLDAGKRYKLRGRLEQVSPEEILQENSETIGTFYYPNKCEIGLHAAHFDFWDINFPFLCSIFLKDARTIIEVGANIGIDTLVMAKYAPENSKIIAFEPSKKYRTILQKNIAKNKLKKKYIMIPFPLARIAVLRSI